MRPQRTAAILAAIVAVTAPAPTMAQDGLRNTFQNLFTFGDCGAALCLGGQSALVGHGNHFIPAAEESGAAALAFVTNAIATNIASVPIPSASGAVEISFVNGLPVRSEISDGPIFGERALTLGKGRFLAGVTVNGLALQSIRGVPLDNLVFNFGHEDLAPAGLGSPTFENDLIPVRTALDVELLVATSILSYGLLSNLDITVAVPFVSVSVDGTSVAQILPIGSGTTPLHLFAGTSTDPVLVSVAEVDESASGIGDIAARLKLKVADGFAIIAEGRFPTGDEANLLGSGEFAMRGLLIFSRRIGGFTPHANLGATYRQAELQNSVFLTTFGFDQLLTNWATLAVDFVGEWEMGDPEIQLAGDIVYSDPFPRSIPSTIIPNRRDDVQNASIGFKLSPSDRFTFITNSIIPLGNGGVQPTVAWTAGFELHF